MLGIYDHPNLPSLFIKLSIPFLYFRVFFKPGYETLLDYRLSCFPSCRSSTMKFQVELANEADIKKILSILFKCYGGKNEYINAVFPRALTDEGFQKNVDRMLLIKHVPPSVFWEKVVDIETGEIVGGAMWNLCDEQKPPPYDIDGPPGTWESDSDKAYAQALQRSFAEDENKLWEENDLPLLGICKVWL